LERLQALRDRRGIVLLPRRQALPHHATNFANQIVVLGNDFTAKSFNFSGKPYLTQKWVRTICNEFYGVEPMHGYGFGQDEDQGQLGAWYVMSSMGLFDVKGLTEIEPKFQIGSPLFDKITIQLNQDYYKGESFVIKTHNNSDQNIYLKSIKYNNQPYNTPFLDFNKVVQGGTLELIMDNISNQ